MSSSCRALSPTLLPFSRQASYPTGRSAATNAHRSTARSPLRSSRSPNSKCAVKSVLVSTRRVAARYGYAPAATASCRTPASVGPRRPPPEGGLFLQGVADGEVGHRVERPRRFAVAEARLTQHADEAVGEAQGVRAGRMRTGEDTCLNARTAKPARLVGSSDVGGSTSRRTRLR